MFEKEITFDRFIRGTLIVLLIVGIFALVSYLSNVLLPFFIAWLLAYLLYPIVKFNQYKLHLHSRVLAIFLTIILVAAIIASVIWLIIPPIVEQFGKLEDIMMSYLHKTTHVHNFSDMIQNWMIQNSGQIEHFFKQKDVTDTIKNALPGVFNVLGQTVNIIISIVASFITLLYMFFILLDYEYLSTNFIRIFPKKVRPFWQTVINDVEKAMNSYMRGQGLVALSVGILFCIGFTIIDFPMAIALGILIGIMDLVPYLHTIALIPTIFLALLKSADTGQNFWIILASALAVFIVVQIIADMLLTPKIMGKAMNLNPAILLLSLSVWGSLLGFVGLIIALPLTTLLMSYYKRYVTKEEKIEEN